MWTIIYCRKSNGIGLHKEAAQISNPNAQVLAIPTKNNFSRRYGWYNADLMVRSNIRKIRKSIIGTNIAIAEWDTCILQQLDPDKDLKNTALWPNQVGHRHWALRRDMKFYKDTYLNNFVYSGSRFSYLEMGIDVLDIWLEKGYDWLYKEDLYCEVRPSTILNSRGVKIGLSGTKYTIGAPREIDFSEPGIYHPVYSKISRYDCMSLFKQTLVSHNNFFNDVFEKDQNEIHRRIK